MITVKGFPDYPAADMPALPEGWTDSTWRNDACPSYAAFDQGEIRVRIWIDYADDVAREVQGGARFVVTHEDWTRLADAQEVDSTVYEGDDWAAAVDAANAMARALKIASAFSALVRRDLGDNLPEIAARNARPDYQGACATHDFADANMIMAEAFESAMGRAIDIASDADCALWNRAWDIARARKFTEV